MAHNNGYAGPTPHQGAFSASPSRHQLGRYAQPEPDHQRGQTGPSNAGQSMQQQQVSDHHRGRAGSSSAGKSKQQQQQKVLRRHGNDAATNSAQAPSWSQQSTSASDENLYRRSQASATGVIFLHCTFDRLIGPSAMLSWLSMQSASVSQPKFAKGCCFDAVLTCIVWCSSCQEL